MEQPLVIPPVQEPPEDSTPEIIDIYEDQRRGKVILTEVRKHKAVLDAKGLEWAGRSRIYSVGNSLAISINKHIARAFTIVRGDSVEQFVHPDGYIILVPRYTPGLQRDAELKIPTMKKKGTPAPYASMSDVLVTPQDDICPNTKDPEVVAVKKERKIVKL